MKSFFENNKKYVVIALFGIIFLLFSGSFSGGDKKISSRNDEKRFESLISTLKDVENPQVMVTYNKEKEVLGVVIITKNTLATKTKKEITNACEAVFGVHSHKIVVLP